MGPQQVTYYAYLLRLWREEQDGQPHWRASLESVRSGRQHGFASPSELAAFLEKQIGSNDVDPPEITFTPSERKKE